MEHIILRVTDQESGSVSKGLEAHVVIKEGATMTWKYSKQFYIKFDEDKNPCIPNSSGDPNIYESSDSVPFIVKCTINTTKKESSFPYAIYPGKPVHKPNGHCPGCCIDTE